MIVTTHNAMLMNRYKKEQLIGVSVVYREKERGTSKFVSFVDLDNFSGSRPPCSPAQTYDIIRKNTKNNDILGKNRHFHIRNILLYYIMCCGKIFREGDR